MNNSKYYSLALEALAELAPELAAAKNSEHTHPAPIRLPLDKVLTGLGNLPTGAQFLGMAEDGLPVLLDLFDPTPGPLLLLGDEQAGKTAFLKMIAQATVQMYSPDEIQFGIVASNRNEWDDFESLPHCAGATSLPETDSMELIASLFEWAHQNHSDGRVALLLLDGFDRINQWGESTRSQLRWLLLRGPARRVWPIVTLNSNRIADIKDWLPLFRTLIYGRISNGPLTETLSDANHANLETLRGGTEFSMREGNHWIRFWIPSLG